MIRTIETHPLGAIQKVTTPKGAVRYQTGTPGSGMTPHPTLTAARAALGVTIAHPEKLTTPKSACPHNQPGYDPSSNRAAAPKVKSK